MNPSPRSVLPFNPVLQHITPAPTGVYTVSYFSPDPEQERTLYIDQYSGAVLKDISYGDYGAASKAVSYSNSLHMGRYFGLANQVLCALISLGLAAMAVTGCVMWWIRRPARSLGAPGRERTAPPHACMEGRSDIAWRPVPVDGGQHACSLVCRSNLLWPHGVACVTDHSPMICTTISRL